MRGIVAVKPVLVLALTSAEPKIDRFVPRTEAG
jgi:hypothetical protein